MQRKVQDRKAAWDQGARNPHFKIGDYVVIKDLSPGEGPGKMKLRPKYIGPFRIIKVYPATLAIIPWSDEPDEQNAPPPNIIPD